jgi:hypothetical protein
MAQAFANDAATTNPDAQAQPEAATTQPAETTETQAPNPSDKAGPIPFDVHSKALENARTKAVAEFSQKSGVGEAVKFSERINSSPPGFWREYTTELLAHPEHGKALRSDLARMFGGLKNQGQAATEAAMPSADVQIVDAAGNVTGMTYSEKQLAARDEWREKQLMAKVSERVKPFEQEREAKQLAERQAAEHKQVEAAADLNITRIDRILDGDTKLYAQVAALIDADPTLDAIDAALEVRKTHIAPRVEGDAQKKVLDNLQTKAAAQGMNPSSAAPATARRPRSLTDSSLQW